METKNTYCTPEQAEQIQKSIAAYFDFEIDKAQTTSSKRVNLTMIQAMIEARIEQFR